jgi:hypothetical protein
VSSATPRANATTPVRARAARNWTNRRVDWIEFMDVEWPKNPVTLEKFQASDPIWTNGHLAGWMAIIPR